MDYQLIDLLVAGILFLINFGIGSSLTFREFGIIFMSPRPLLAGIGLQIVFLPVLAFLIACSVDLPAPLRAGIVIIAACPGGTTSNFISYLTKGDVALSIAMTGVNNVITLITIPVVVNVALNLFLGNSTEISLPFGQTLGQIVLLVILPVILGLALKYYRGRLADRFQRPIKVTSVLLLGIMFAVKTFATESSGGSGLDVSTAMRIFPPVFVLHLASLFAGYAIARVLKIYPISAVTIGIEVGLQNTALAILVAGTFLGQRSMTQPAVVYALFSFWTTLLFGWLMLRRKT